MKYIKFCIASLLLLLASASFTYAMELSLNKSRFIPSDNLILTLSENWSGKADVYIAVSLPGDDSLFFLSQQGFVADLVPFVEAVSASNSREIFNMVLAEGVATGEYTFYAAAMRSGSFFEMVLDVSSISFIVAAEAEPVDLTFADTRLPDGVIGRRYSFAIEPKTGNPPYKFSLSDGELPKGLTLGSDSGLIQGEPTERSMAQFKVKVVDAKGNVGEIEAAIKVFGILSFGEHGTYKGCNGLQMAFNSAQNLDEIRIEQGTYECNGLEIPKSKTFEHGIKISGGWDSGFENQSDKPELTVFDGGAKRIDGVENEEKCKEAGGIWNDKLRVCFQEEPPEKSILSVSANGSVDIDGLYFKNGYSSDRGGAISGNVSITNCVFTHNSASDDGGAVSYSATITNSTFSNNSASEDGGAVYDVNTITNSSFTNNSAYSIDGNGGAVYGANTITNSSFSNNSASYGGAVYYREYYSTIITNSTFTNNSASYGGAFYSSYNRSTTTITNSTFSNNSASGSGGAGYGANTITNSTFTNNSASYDGAVSSVGTIINSTFTNNSTSSEGWAIISGGTIINSIFTKNSTKKGYIINGDSTIINSTIANNNGGGFYGSGTILNTIFAENKLGEEANDITPNGNLHVDYTLVNHISGAVDLGTNIIMGDPRFVDAENGDFRLRSDSPAINVGDSSVVESYSFLKDDAGNVIDLDGKPRVVGGTIDLGAYEVQ